MKTNCPNCGAPINTDYDKCPYCGTEYYDLTAIPLDKPFYIKLKKDGMTFIAKVKTRGLEVNQESEPYSGGIGNCFTGSYGYTTTMSLDFEVVPEFLRQHTQLM